MRRQVHAGREDATWRQLQPATVQARREQSLRLAQLLATGAAAAQLTLTDRSERRLAISSGQASRITSSISDRAARQATPARFWSRPPSTGVQRRPAARQGRRSSDVVTQSRSTRQASTTRVASVQPVLRTKTRTSIRPFLRGSQVPFGFARRTSRAENVVVSDPQSLRAGPSQRAVPLTVRPSAEKRPSTAWNRPRQRNEPSARTGVPRGDSAVKPLDVPAGWHGAPTPESVMSERPS